MYDNVFITLTLTVSGDANFSIGMSVGGFIQPSVARSLIELQSNVEKGLCQRFLWLCPKATFVKFDQLQKIDDVFSTSIGEKSLVTPTENIHKICIVSFIVIFHYSLSNE